MNLGNTQLVEYGIEKWAATVDLMFHVGIVTKRVYRYAPAKAWQLIQNGNFELVSVHTGKYTTAKGWLIPPEKIPGCIGIVIPHPIFYKAGFQISDSPTLKGQKCERVVKEMLMKGYLSLTLDAVLVPDRQLQLDAIDIIPIQATEIQVKCDWRAGSRELGGSGNLFIQKNECNPLRQY